MAKKRSKNFFIIILILVLVSVLFVSCDDTQTIKNIDDDPMPAANIQFSANIYPILSVKCNFSGCHNDESQAGGVSLTSWANVTNPRIVVKGDTATSVLVWSITKIPGAKWMPPINYPPLTSEQIRGIKTWIQEGAQNN
jgi:hypothetical protein